MCFCCLSLAASNDGISWFGNLQPVNLLSVAACTVVDHGKRFNKYWSFLNDVEAWPYLTLLSTWNGTTNTLLFLLLLFLYSSSASCYSSSPSTPPLSILLLSIYYCSPSTSILPFTAQLHLCHKPSFTRPQQSSELLLRHFGGNCWFAKENKLSGLQLIPPPNEKSIQNDSINF